MLLFFDQKEFNEEPLKIFTATFQVRRSRLGLMRGFVKLCFQAAAIVKVQEGLKTSERLHQVPEML